MAQLFAEPFFTALDANGNPISGAKLYFYATGTTTPQNVFTTDGLTVAHANPVVANSAGRFAAIYLDPDLIYRVDLKDAGDVAIGPPVDPLGNDTFGALGLAAGAGLVGASHNETYAEGTLGDRFRKEIFVTDEPFGAVGDADTLGTNDTAAFIAAIAHIEAQGGGLLRVPAGKYKITANLHVDFDGLRIEGDSMAATELWIYHDGKAVSYQSPVENLPNGKFSMNNITIVNKQGYPLDGAGFPQATHDGTAIELYNCFGSTFTNVLVEGFDVSLSMIDCAMLEFVSFTDRNCWTGITAPTHPVGGQSNYTNSIAFRGGVTNNSSVNTYFDDVKLIQFDNRDFEAASQTMTFGDGVSLENCRIERLHISRTWFKWIQISGNGCKIINSTRIFWDGSATPGGGEDDFFIEVSGRDNLIEIPYVFNHEKVIRLTEASTGNVVDWSAPFDDFANSNSNALFRFSRRFHIDAGSNNRLIQRSRSGIVDALDDRSLIERGDLTTYLRDAVLANLTVSGGAGLTSAASDIVGPFGVAATNTNLRKFTLTTAVQHRAYADPSITGDGSTKYAIACYVYIPSGSTGVTRVRLGIGDGNFINLYKTDGADRWHRVWGFHQTPNATAIQWMIDAEGDDGDVFYIGFPSLSRGEIPTYIDRKNTDTTNTLIGATSFDSNALRYNAALI